MKLFWRSLPRMSGSCHLWCRCVLKDACMRFTVRLFESPGLCRMRGSMTGNRNLPMQEVHEAELAVSVAQQQLVHERQRTGRLKQAIKSAFEDARTPAAGITGETAPVWHECC